MSRLPGCPVKEARTQQHRHTKLVVGELIMRACPYRALRCRLGTLAEAHVISDRPIPPAALPSRQHYQVLSAGLRLEARPAPFTEPKRCRGRRSDTTAFSPAAVTPVRCAPCWYRGPEVGVAAAPIDGWPTGYNGRYPRNGTKRHVSTGSSAAADGQDVERATPRASDSSRQSMSPSPSLQKLLGISAEEAEIIRKKEQTTRKGFHNLVIASASGDDGKGRDTDSGLDAEDDAKDISPQRSPSCCFPRFLLDELHAKPKDVKSLVLRRPAVLGWSAVATEKVSRWLQETVGMRRSEVTRLLLKNPEAGTKTVENNIEPKVEWLRDNLNLAHGDKRGVIKILLHAPQILNLSAERSLEPTLCWLKGRLRISRQDAAKIARENPTLFFLNLEKNVEPTLAWLLERLETADEGAVLAMLVKAPNILSLSTRTGLEPKLAWLRDRLGLNPREICEMVTREPTILYKSLADNLEPKLAWFKTDLNLDDVTTRKMLVAFPRLLGTSLAGNLKLKLPWFHEALGLDAGEAVALVTRAPFLLECSITDNLDPTVAFFRVEMGASKEELKAAVMRNPKVLLHSLDGRLRPRVAAMRLKKVQPVFSQHKSNVVRWSDSRFQGFLDSYGR